MKKKYQIEISEQARADIKDLQNVIIYEYKSYRTAICYVEGLEKTICNLQTTAESFQFQSHPFFRKYGLFVYRVNYKKMAIIYTVNNDLVVIQRVIAASLITNS